MVVVRPFGRLTSTATRSIRREPDTVVYAQLYTGLLAHRALRLLGMTTFQPINEVQDAKANRKARQAFYTPRALAREIVSVARTWPSSKALEPSAGDGRFIHEMQEAGIHDIDACEMDEAMYGRCESLGANMVGTDFLAYEPGQVYDLILMNPPFKNKQAQQHIEHAWSLLKDGGQLMAIGPDTLRQQLWNCDLDLPGCTYAVYETIDPKAFKDFGANVKTILITLERGDDRPCESFSNAQTFNAAMVVTCDARLLGRVVRNTAEHLRGLLAEPIAELGGSCYGVDWDEVAAYMRETHPEIDEIPF